MICTTTKGDFPQLLEIWQNAVKSTHTFLVESDYEFYKSLIPEYFERLDLYVYKDDKDTIRGFLAIEDDRIEMLFVDNDARGKGIGSELVIFATDKIGAYKLDVNEQNSQAVEFYKHLGFETIGRSNEDAHGKPYPLLHLEKR